MKSLVKRITRKNKNLESNLPLTISAQHGLVDQITFFNKQVASKDVSGYYLVKNGEFAYNKSYSSGYPWGAIKRLDNYDKGVLSTLYIVFKPTDIASGFLVSYYDTTFWHREVSMRAAEGARNHGLLNISAQDFFETELLTPTQPEEQDKIGAFFKQLDDTIALHQRKLENLRSLKSTYLYYLFPSGTEKKPKLRFSNFKNEWDLHTLNDISEKIIEKNTKNIYKETLTNSAEYGIINQREFFSKDISNEKNLDGYYVVRNNDFVYNPRISNLAPVGPIKRNKLNRIGVMSPLYYVFRPSNINFDFLEYFFETTLWHKFMKVNGDSGARSDRFAIKDSVLKLMPIPFPTSSEQKEIGTFFEKIDDAITLHQHKLEQMKNLKQAYLQKMFI